MWSIRLYIVLLRCVPEGARCLLFRGQARWTVCNRKWDRRQQALYTRSHWWPRYSTGTQRAQLCSTKCLRMIQLYYSMTSHATILWWSCLMNLTNNCPIWPYRDLPHANRVTITRQPVFSRARKNCLPSTEWSHDSQKCKLMVIGNSGRQSKKFARRRRNQCLLMQMYRCADPGLCLSVLL